MEMRSSKQILIAGALLLLVGFIIIQFAPLARHQVNPPIQQEPDWDSPETRSLAERACFDCHSNETEWPWYGKIFPMSVKLQEDVYKGRERLNFSEWSRETDKETNTEQMVELVSKGEMPLPYYLVLHPEAQLSEAETSRLINGLIDTMSPGEALQAEDTDEVDPMEEE